MKNKKRSKPPPKKGEAFRSISGFLRTKKFKSVKKTNYEEN